MTFRTTSNRLTFTIIGPPEEDREKGTEILFEEIMVEDFHNLEEETDYSIHKLKRVQRKMNPKRHTSSRHIIIKMLIVKDKEKIKNSKIKTICYVKFVSKDFVA